MAATNYNISTNYEDGADEGKGLWGTIKDLASAAWSGIENSLKGDRYGRIEKASQAQDRIDELNNNINSGKLSQDQIASSNNEIARLTQKRDDYLSGNDANRWELYDKAALGLFHIDEEDIFKVASKNANTLANLSDKAKDNRINELKKGANSLGDFLSNVDYDVKNENAFQTYVDVTNGNREQLKDNKKGTGFGGFMQDTISDIYKQIDVKDMTITDRDGNKVFYMAEEAPMVLSKLLSDDIQDALQNNYNYIKKYESYLNSGDEAKIRTANEQKMINNYEAAIDNIERIKEGVAYMYNNYQKYNGDQGKISYAYYNDHGYSIFSTSDRTDLKLSDLNLISDEAIKKIYGEELYGRTPWGLIDALDVGKFSTESLTSEDFGILATNMLAYHENVNEFKDSITGKYGANSVRHAFRSLLSLTGDGSILSNSIENFFSYATAYGQLTADMAIGAGDMILKTVEYGASKLGYGENPLGDGLTLMDLFDYEMAQQHGMLSTDLIKDQITNDESWASEILGMAATTIDAAPDIAMQLPLITASEAAIVRVFPENPTIFANASKYISNLTKSKNGLTMFKNYDAAMSKLNTSQFLKVKLGEFATRAIAQNYVLGAAAQGAVSEDYTDLDFFLDAAFSLFDAVVVTKSYRAGKPKLEQSFRDWFWNDYFIKNGLNIGDEDYLRMMQKDPQTVMAVGDKLRESFNKGLNAYAHNEGIANPGDAFNKYFQIYKESKSQLGYSAAMDEWNKATKNINTSILATAIKNSDSISDSIKNKIVKEVVKYADGTEGYRYRFNEKLTKEEFDEVSRILEGESSVRDGDMVTKYTKNGKDESVTTFTYKDEAGNSISEKEARAYDIMEAYAGQVKTGFLMNRFRQWEYDKFADKTKHMFGDVEYSWIGAKDPEAVFRERMEQFAKDYDEFDKLLREQSDEGLDARFYGKHTKKEVDQYEKVSGKKNLVNIGLEEARKIFKNLDTVSNDFYKTLCNNRFLSLYEKNEILYNVLNTEKETLFTFDKKPQKLFGSEFEKTYYIGNKRVAKKGNQYAGNVDVISKGGDKIGTMNYYINQQTGVINGNEIIYETIMIVDKEGKPFAQINMIEGTLELSDKYGAEEGLDYHFNVGDRESMQYSSRIYGVDEIGNQDINLKDRVMLTQKISNALTSNIKHGEATRGPGITSATINDWLNLLNRGAASDFQIQNWMKKTGFYQLPGFMQSIPFSYFLELKHSIAKHSLTGSEGAELLTRCCLSDIRELTGSYMVTAGTRLKDDRLKRFFMGNKGTLAVTNSLINKEGFGRTIVKYESVEGHQGLYILKDISGNEIGTLGINVGSKSNKSDTGKFFFEIGGEVRAMSSGEDMLIIKDAGGDLDTYTKKLTKKERQELIVSEGIDEKTEFKSILSGKYDKTTIFSDSLKVSNDHKRDVGIITALKTLTVKASMSDSHIRPAYIIQELLGTEFGNKIASKFGFGIGGDRKAHEILLKHVKEGSLSEIEGSYVRIGDGYFLSLDPEVSLGYKMNYRPEIDTLLFAVEEANMPGVYRTISIPKAGGLRHTEVDGIHYLQWRRFLVKLDPTVTEVQRNNNINLFKLDSDRARALNKATEIREAGNETIKELDNLVNDISAAADDETADKVKKLGEQSIKETGLLPKDKELIDTILETLSDTELGAYLLNRYDVRTVEDAEKLLTLYGNIDTGIYRELYEKYNGNISQEEFNKYLELALDPYGDIPPELQVMQYYGVQRGDRYSLPYISYENCDVIRERIETMIELGSGNNPQKITGRVYGYMNKRVKAYKMQGVLEDIEKGIYDTQKKIETAFELASKDIPVENIQSEFSNAVTKKKKMLFTEEMTTGELDAAYDTLNRMMDLGKGIHKTLSEGISSIKGKKIKDWSYIEEFMGLPVTMESIYELINTANFKGHSINDVLYTMGKVRNIVVGDDYVKEVKKILKADREKLFKDMANILSSDDRGLKQVFVKGDAGGKVKPPRKRGVRSSSKKVNEAILEENKKAAGIKETAETETKIIEEGHIDGDGVLPEKVEVEEPKGVGDLENADPKAKTLDEEIEDLEDIVEEYAFDMADEEYERLKDLMLFAKDQLYNTSGTKFGIKRIEKIIGILKIIDSLKVEDVTKEIKKAFDDFAKDVRDNLNSRGIIINTDTPTVHELLTNQDDWSYVFEPDWGARGTNKLTVKVRTAPIYADGELIRRGECAITGAEDTLGYFKEVISGEHDASRYTMSNPDIEKDWGLKEGFDYVNNKPVTKDEVSEVINDLKDDVVKEGSKLEDDVVENADEALRGELGPKVENGTPKTARKAAFKEIKEINNKSEFKCKKGGNKKFSTIPDDKFDAGDFIEGIKNHFEGKKILPQLLDPEIIDSVLSNKTLANSNYGFQIIGYYLYLGYSLPEKANKVLASMIGTYESSLKNLTNNEILYRLSKTCANTEYFRNVPSIKDGYLYLKGASKYEDLRTLYSKIAGVWGEGSIGTNADMLDRIDRYFFGKPDLMYYKYNYRLLGKNGEEYIKYLQRAYRDGVTFSGLTKNTIAKMGPMSAYEYFVYGKVNPKGMKALSENPLRLYNLKSGDTALRDIHDKFFEALAGNKYKEEFIKELEGMGIKAISDYFDLSPYVKAKTYSFIEDKGFEVFNVDSIDYLKKAVKKDKIILVGHDNPFELIEDLEWLRKNGYDMSYDQVKGEIKASSDPDRKVLENMNKNGIGGEGQTKNTVEGTYCNLGSKK